jgi:Cysteine-rich CWC
MSVISQSAGPAREPRRLACARCGAAFECGVGTGHCWCAEEDFRLPMPAEGSGEDCLCPACLRKAAGAHGPRHGA